MARPISLTTKNLRELQKAMKDMETSIEASEVKPILAGALMIFKTKALELLRRLTKRATHLPPGWEHIEDALKVQEGKSNTLASAFAKVFRKGSPQAIWIEFGHRIVGPKPRKTDTGKGVVAFPFFRTAFDMTRKEMLKHVRLGVQGLLRSASLRAGFSGDGSGPDDTGWIG